MMTDAPGRFTAPVAGTYHFVTGCEPHLTSDCTDSCRTISPMFVGSPGEIRRIECDTLPAGHVPHAISRLPFTPGQWEALRQYRRVHGVPLDELAGTADVNQAVDWLSARTPGDGADV